MNHAQVTILNHFKPFTLIINQILYTGIFPDHLKIARVLPLFKKDDQTIFSNYRPISLLPSFSKVIEKIIFNQLYEYFDCHKYFYPSQYGFRKNHSTEHAALELIDKIITDMVIYQLISISICQKHLTF